MPAADDIETRLAIVERDVTQLREQLALTISDAGAARMLAAGADHDVSEVRAELRAHTQALNALRETQLEQGREMREGFAEQGRRIDEQGQKIDEQTRRIDEQGQKIDEQTRRIDEQTREMREGFATLATGMAQITTLLTNLAGTEGLR
jgi:DNA anti-recombination protein RmuC